ncbi:MAG: nucleotidyl transferase AbiEii/AbiGii toxin family protein [Nocardiopsaceae bacterium]|nr:nucleotidyl transferase AbiEii/AbiGii toxin family protein [Nocardiopsaceae bacterium]
MTGLEEVLRRAAADLDGVGAKWAIIGGLAVATRAAPRFTQDVDFAVSVRDDAEAEDIVHRMSVRGYGVGMMLEQEYVHRLATIRLVRPIPGTSQVFVDLLFGSSGIEDQVVAQADRLEVWPQFQVPVARVGHLIALKLLSRDERRLQDQLDLRALREVATDADLEDARKGVALIVERGYHRDRALEEDFEQFVREAS